VYESPLGKGYTLTQTEVCAIEVCACACCRLPLPAAAPSADSSAYLRLVHPFPRDRRLRGVLATGKGNAYCPRVGELTSLRPTLNQSRWKHGGNSFRVPVERATVSAVPSLVAYYF
jgi:hypothetical protein